jgi:serine/threonine protein kinase/cytochrome c-type biogenesis protein CcmH/NrfG
MNSPPTTLGQYQIIREIARSNDIVYEAYDPLMNRRVAIKELSMPTGATSQQQDERTSRFRREAQAAGTLNHPNIMTVFTFAEDAGRTFMAMEYLDGCSLRNELDTKGVLPATRAIEIAIDVLRGLEHAHAKGVIHRDIKPDNVQILSNGSIKITDFGIARLTFQPNLTMDGQVFGTPSYMSPEQVVGKEIDARSDLFSLGVMLYEMVSGQKPFAGDSVVSITYAIMNKEPQQPSGIDWQLWSVISKALEKTPSTRYGSANEMLKALEGVLHPVSPLLDPMQANPYGSPAMNVPPIVPPSYGGASVQVQPYNPYAPQQPPQNPTVAGQGIYTQPYVPGGAPQTAQGPYNYNPYQPAPGMGTQGGMAPQYPIYYPPPPRVPLLKPEQVMFLKRLSVAMILGITLVALIIVGLSSWASIADEEQKKASDSKLDPRYTSVDARLSVASNIENLQQGMGMARDDGTKAQIGAKLGDLYKQEGQQQEAANDVSHAEASYQNAAKYNPSDPDVIAKEGRLLYSQARAQTDPTEQQTLFKGAADKLSQAASLETASADHAKNDEDRQAAAWANYEYAQVTQKIDPNSPQNKTEIRDALLAARDQANSGSDLASYVQAMLAEYQ